MDQTDGMLNQNRLNEILALLDNAGNLDGLPPVEKWNPQLSGDINIRIDSDGRWYYQDDLMTRDALVKLFAGILRREEDGNYYLVTPVEKMRIQVDDVPFVLIDYCWNHSAENKVVTFKTNLGDEVRLEKNNSFCFPHDHADIPYVHVRRGLLARLSRGVYYQLVNEILDADSMASHTDEFDIVLLSDGVSHRLAR